jgi:hypothetical protein
MSHDVLVYDPIAPCVTQPQQTRRALDALAGKVIGFLDNSKPNFNHLVEDVSQVLMQRHGAKAVMKRRKRSASEGAPESVINELVEHADAVITGSGD